MLKKNLVLLLLINFTAVSIYSASMSRRAGDSPREEARWWPVTKAPGVVHVLDVNDMKSYESSKGETVHVRFGQEHMLAASLAGLAAQAVNEGRGNEMVWIKQHNIESHGPDYEMWFRESKKRIGFEDAGEKELWNLVKYFKDKGIVKGYVLYTHDFTQGEIPSLRKGLNHSANAATVACSIEQGVMIAEEIEDKAKAIGLKMLVDARGKDEGWAFGKYKEHLNRDFVFAHDPIAAHHRPLAIAHKVPVIFGIEEPTPTIYAWMNKPGGVMGWNAPGEGEFVEQLSRHGHILLPSNWCMNLTILSSGTLEYDVPLKFHTIDPAEVDYSDKSPAVSFIMSDGDNVQWLMGDFVHNQYYWASSNHGDYPIGWGMPYGDLDQVCPEVMELLYNTQPRNATINLHAGGYYMPDIYGEYLEDDEAEAALRKHARRVGYYINRYGLRTCMFLCQDLDSPGAIKAYTIFAEEIDCLAGMFVIQYMPYNPQDGGVYWVKNSKGIDIPVISCEYLIWANTNMAKAGTPAAVARMINEDAAKAQSSGQRYLEWGMTHTWSGFKKIEGNDEKAENDNFMAPGTQSAVTPTGWCVERLDEDIKVITPEELLWRLRMEHNPADTQKAINAISRGK
jgi:hypothetical protein